MESSRPRILVLLEFYLPGYKSGGPVRSVANMVDQLGDRFEYWIVTRDHDFTETTPYPGIEAGRWVRVGKAMVYYVPGGRYGAPLFQRLVAEVDPAAVYLNSFFAPMSRRFLVARRLGRVPKTPVVIAPRGELADAVMGTVLGKKRVYSALTSWLGFYGGLLWQATAPHEVQEIHALLGAEAEVHLAANFPRAVPESSDHDGRSPKRPGAARLVFLSRIAPKKNLSFALEALREVRGDVTFDIYGPIDSKATWDACQAVMATLPENIRVSYQGSIPSEQVVEMLGRYDFLVLPTTYENFGHVIFESFVAGRPVVLSDQTPWRDLAAQSLGWDLPLDDPQAWRRVLQECVDMDEPRFGAMSSACLEYARRWPAASNVLGMNAAMFDKAVSQGRAMAPAMPG